LIRGDVAWRHGRDLLLIADHSELIEATGIKQDAHGRVSPSAMTHLARLTPAR
jgi:hypothetical protein